MGWKGTLRSMEAAARRSARESERRAKQAEKARISDEAFQAVENWKEHLTNLTCQHDIEFSPIDWFAIVESDAPECPSIDRTQSENTRSRLASYDKSGSGFLFRKSEKKREKILRSLDLALEEEDKLFEEKMKEFETSKDEHDQEVQFAQQILANETEAIVEAFSRFQVVSHEGYIGERFELQYDGSNWRISLMLFSNDIIPDFRLKQLASGKLSNTKMPKSENNLYYQDYVVSASIRMVLEIFRITNLQEVYVDCYSDMLNSATGHLEKTLVLSVQFVRPTLLSLNLNRLDPSDCLVNFNHNMKFSNTKGMQAVEIFELEATS